MQRSAGLLALVHPTLRPSHPDWSWTVAYPDFVPITAAGPRPALTGFPIESRFYRDAGRQIWPDSATPLVLCQERPRTPPPVRSPAAGAAGIARPARSRAARCRGYGQGAAGTTGRAALPPRRAHEVDYHVGRGSSNRKTDSDDIEDTHLLLLTPGAESLSGCRPGRRRNQRSIPG